MVRKDRTKPRKRVGSIRPRATAKKLAVLRADQPDGVLSQRKLALRAGIGPDRYWRIEDGWTEATDDEKARIAEVLGVHVRDIKFTLRRRDELHW